LDQRRQRERSIEAPAIKLTQAVGRFFAMAHEHDRLRSGSDADEQHYRCAGCKKPRRNPDHCVSLACRRHDFARPLFCAFTFPFRSPAPSRS
jgi:hypothetical protein